MEISLDVDTSICQMASSLYFGEGFPQLDSISIQLVGSETGTVYSEVTNGLIAVVIIAAMPDGDANATSAMATAIEYGLMAAMVPIPVVENGEMLYMALEFTEGDFSVVVDFPGFDLPGCDGPVIEFPCDVDATFAALETPCGVFSVIAPPQPGSMETWTLNGSAFVPAGDPHAFTLTLADGVHTLCRTVTSLLLPNCSDTYCQTFVVDCAVDSCDYSFTHELMTMGAVNSSLTYTEDHIDLTFAGFDNGSGSGPSVGNAFIDYAIPGIGNNQVLLLSNINADYDLTSLINVSGVTFDYFDGAGIENLMVNGDFLIGEFGALYGSTFTLGGVDVFITRVSAAGYDYGEVILTGNVQSFAVGGQQFYVDDVCVSAEGVDCTNDNDQDGICDEDEVAGCTNAGSTNYNPNATDDDGSCQDVLGCTDADACNYNPNATSPDPNLPCLFAVPGYNCLGECIQDLNQNGLCDFLEEQGCMDAEACNYNPSATIPDPDLPCLYAVPGYNCLGECVQDLNENGLCDFLEEQGCMDAEACNYNPNATIPDPDLPCLYAVPGYNCLGEASSQDAQILGRAIMTRMPRSTIAPVTMAAPTPTTPRKSSRQTESSARWIATGWSTSKPSRSAKRGVRPTASRRAATCTPTMASICTSMS